VNRFVACVGALFFALSAAAQAAPARVTVTIRTTGAAAKAPLSGRMLVFAEPAHGKQPPADLDPGFVADGFTLAGFDVDERPGTGIAVPDDASAYPRPLSTLEPGTYDVQALLDVKHMYSYGGVIDGDLTGPVTRLHIAPGTHLVLNLDRVISKPAPKATRDVKLFDMISPSLSKFYGRPTHLRASVLLPVGYDPKQRYPVIYWQNGFGGSYRTGFGFAKRGLREMMAKDGLHALLVVTDSSGPTGITQFADSANNGPWGHAFVNEFVPAVERAFPVDGRPSRRFLWGHSSGGWASLWLQVTYPNVFGGTWSSSPDPVDFHDFTGPDLLNSPEDNAYADNYGRPWQLVRMGTKNVMTLRDFVLSSDVEGYDESQFGSFDAVFSPRGADGKPVPLFDHRTGVVNQDVAAYWEAHYDIASTIERNYVALAPSLQHKLHIAVGTLDTFHLERGVLRLDARLRQLGMNPSITYFPNASHVSMFQAAQGYEGFHWAFKGMAAAAKR
jgi:S-formylglutathione hydrolase FrmB